MGDTRRHGSATRNGHLAAAVSILRFMAYLRLGVVAAQRYETGADIGAVSLMLPFRVVVKVAR
jgi:p-aminobenzoyl-glutamate transporter AbgT